jgi:phosphoribosylanthranilate isomerase
MVRVKICGITTLDDALVAAAAGADALGFNFWPQSPRYLEPARAAAILEHLPPLVTAVGVFVNARPQEVERAARRAGLTTVQLHGDEEPEEVKALAAAGLTIFKAVSVGARFRPQELKRFEGARAFLLDAKVKGARGGTGKSFDWKQARAARRFGRILLAGGLSAENVAEAIAAAQPFGVDVCTGVEKRPGVKNHELVREFIRRAKRVAVA